MNIEDFSDVSVRGKTAYAILCFEEYIKANYPDTDMMPVLELAWKQTCTPLFENAYKFVEIIPECLFEFDEYNAEFEEISEEEFHMFRKLLNNTDEDLNELMLQISYTLRAYEGTRINDNGIISSYHLEKVISILEKNNIPLPDIKKVLPYTSDKRDGWGEKIYPKGISTMLFLDN